MLIKKILWASDGSKESNEALRLALYLGNKFSAGMICLHVNEVHIPITHLHPSYEGLILDLTRESGSKFMQKFEDIAAKNPGIKFTSKVITDKVVEGIIHTAGREGADLIIMGKHGHGMIERALLGSNTLKVLRKSSIPVLSIKTEKDVKDFHIGKILVPMDISDTAESALFSALRLAETLGATITVLYVFWISGNVYELSPGLVDELVEHSKSELEANVKRIKSEYAKVKGKEPSTKIETEVINGASPGVTVVDYAGDKDFDLIMVTTHGRKGFERLLLGSETEKIIREARCPVLALKP